MPVVETIARIRRDHLVRGVPIKKIARAKRRMEDELTIADSLQGAIPPKRVPGHDPCRGDTLFLYTDGIFGAMNDRGDMFGEARLRTALSTGNSAPVDALIDNVTLAVTDFVGEASQSDDVACLALRYDGKTARPPRITCFRPYPASPVSLIKVTMLRPRLRR